MSIFKSSKKLRMILWVVAIGLTVLIIMQLMGNSSKEIKEEGDAKSTNVKPALTVDQVIPKLTMMHGSIFANGSVSAWQEAIIGAEVNGLAIQEVLVNVGDQVKRGQVIARFNDRSIQAELAQAQANLAETQAAMLEAEGNAQRARSIQDTGALSKQQIEQLFGNEASTRARYQSAQAALNAQKIKLNQTMLVALDNGVISKRDATVGQVVSAGQELFRLIRQGRIEWRGEFNSENIGKIQLGMEVLITLPDNTQLTGRVRALAPTTETTTRNTLVYVDIPNQKARPGMFAKGEIKLAEMETYTLPNSAIVMRDGYTYVMQIDNTNHIRQKKITIGKRNAELVEVIGLPDIHATYVASGGAFLSDGDLVRVTKSTDNN